MSDELLDKLTEYNEYQLQRIKMIMDFDIWYEATTGEAFPKEWYGIINNRKNIKEINS